jgi:DNA-directed RNA polymerase specialized sigma24 family protein
MLGIEHSASRALVMINVSATVPPTDSRELADHVREQLDALLSYAVHLVGDPDDAVDFVTAGIYHASRYPPARLRTDGRAALYRAVTRACHQEQRYPPRPRGPSRFLKRPADGPRIAIDATAACRRNTVKRSLSMLSFERRAALLLRDVAGLDYREMSKVLECSPDATARMLAAARREFGTIYREIAL